MKALDALLVGSEITLSAATGIALGYLAILRPSSGSAAASAPATKESRTGSLGTVIWLTVIGMRVGVGVLGEGHGLELASSPGIILFGFAINRFTRKLVLVRRASRTDAKARTEHPFRIMTEKKRTSRRVTD